jgi:hypothetical protein
MNMLLLAFVIIKAVCLLFCWKAFIITKKSTHLSKKEQNDIKTRMEKLVAENQRLTKQFETVNKERSSETSRSSY